MSSGCGLKELHLQVGEHTVVLTTQWIEVLSAIAEVFRGARVQWIRLGRGRLIAVRHQTHDYAGRARQILASLDD
jgi:hypothetical protein